MTKHWALTLGAGAMAGGGWFGGGSDGGGHTNPSPNDVKKMIAAAASSAGIDPRLPLAIAKHESDFRQYDSDGNVLMSDQPNSHATGIFQLQPGTARALGVNPNDPQQNIQGGVALLRQLLQQYRGNQELALEHYIGSSDPSRNAAYAHQVMSIENGITINTLQINVPSGNPADVRQSVADGLTEAQRRQAQRVMAEWSDMSWSY